MTESTSDLPRITKQKLLNDIVLLLEAASEEDFDYNTDDEDRCEECNDESCYDYDECSCDCHEYPGFYHYAADKIYRYIYQYIKPCLD